MLYLYTRVNTTVKVNVLIYNRIKREINEEGFARAPVRSRIYNPSHNIYYRCGRRIYRKLMNTYRNQCGNGLRENNIVFYELQQRRTIERRTRDFCSADGDARICIGRRFSIRKQIPFSSILLILIDFRS